MTTTPSFTLCELSRLSGAITATSSAVNGTIAHIDLGAQGRQYAGAPGATDNSAPAAFGRFTVVVDVGAIDVSSLNESYVIELQGSATSDFAVAYRLGSLTLGHSSTTGNATSTPPNCRRSFLCDNRYYPDSTAGNVSACARFVRLRIVPSGTTPSLVVGGAWLLPL
ncbi:MAG: hypothetical protein ACK53T_12445 [Planctomycetota bacterium]